MDVHRVIALPSRAHLVVKNVTLTQHLETNIVPRTRTIRMVNIVLSPFNGPFGKETLVRLMLAPLFDRAHGRLHRACRCQQLPGLHQDTHASLLH